MASVTVPRRCRALKIATPSGPRLAIKGERRRAKLHRGDDDCRIPAAPVVAGPSEESHCVAVAANLQAVAVVLDLVNPVGPGRWPRGQVGMQGETNPLATVFGRSMRQFYRLARSGGNREIAAVVRGSGQMKGLSTSALALGLWWRIAVALSAVLAVDASLTDNRALAFVTVALCAALMVYAGAVIAGQRMRG
jgi:hypothetical protein